MRRLLIATTALIGLVVCQEAQAQTYQTTTATIAVTASVDPSCSVTATPLAFLTVPASTVVNSTATLNVTCTNGATYEVGLDNGANAASGQRNLIVTGGSTLLAYNLYQDSTHTLPWTNTPGPGTSVVQGTGSGSAQALTVYGQIPSTASPVSGVYTDTVTVTVYF
jgi:spore coat protein U-like protein